MTTPQLYRQLLEQLGQWIIPKDLRHLEKVKNKDEKKKKIAALTHRKYALLKNEVDLNELQNEKLIESSGTILNSVVKLSWLNVVSILA